MQSTKSEARPGWARVGGLMNRRHSEIDPGAVSAVVVDGVGIVIRGVQAQRDQ
jgi:hypothetical protein